MNLSLPVASDRLPFRDMALFKASRLDEAHEQIARLVNPHRITVLSDPSRLNVRFDGIRDEDLSFLHIQYGASVDVKPDESKEYFFVQTTMEGSSLVLKGRDEYPAPVNHTVVVSPDRPYRMRIAAGTKRMVVGIRVAALERHLAHLCGHALDEPLIFAPDWNSSAVASVWFGHIRNLYSLFKTEALRPTKRDVQAPSLRRNLHAVVESFLTQLQRDAVESVYESLIAPMSYGNGVHARQLVPAVRRLQMWRAMSACR